MSRKLMCLVVLFPLFVLAEGNAVGAVATSGSSARLSVQGGQRYEAQCTADSRFRTGNSTVTVANSPAGDPTQGRKILANQLLEFATEPGDTAVAFITADGTTAGSCTVFLKPYTRHDRN